MSINILTKMKIRVYKSQLHKALMWYTHKLYEKHHFSMLTPANIELLKRDLYELQNYKQKRENNPIWKVPVGVLIYEDTHSFEVVVADESNVLYLHEL